MDDTHMLIGTDNHIREALRWDQINVVPALVLVLKLDALTILYMIYSRIVFRLKVEGG